jgi:hypothetical protein
VKGATYTTSQFEKTEILLHNIVDVVFCHP